MLASLLITMLALFRERYNDKALMYRNIITDLTCFKNFHMLSCTLLLQLFVEIQR